MLDAINDVLWGKIIIVALIALGVVFTVASRFVQFRYFFQMFAIIRQAFHHEAGHLSSFQALALSVAGRVGAGNIAGVAVAISLGGPGAIFWMWMVAFLGASTAYVESTLGQIYKEVDENGQYRGGPAYYIEKAMGQKWYAWIFAVATAIAMGLLLPGVQANSIAQGVSNAWGVAPEVSAAVMVVVLANSTAVPQTSPSPWQAWASPMKRRPPSLRTGR